MKIAQIESSDLFVRHEQALGETVLVSYVPRHDALGAVIVKWGDDMVYSFFRSVTRPNVVSVQFWDKSFRDFPIDFDFRLVIEERIVTTKVHNL